MPRTRAISRALFLKAPRPSANTAAGTIQAPHGNAHAPIPLYAIAAQQVINKAD